MIFKQRRYIYLAIGWLFTGLGFVGAFLPVMPTTPFLLVAVWAFSKSSPRLKAWLYNHPRFGYHIQAWFNQGAISRKAKILSVSFMSISVGFSIYISENTYVIVALILIVVSIATFILTRPSPKGVVIKSQLDVPSDK